MVTFFRIINDSTEHVYFHCYSSASVIRAARGFATLLTTDANPLVLMLISTLITTTAVAAAAAAVVANAVELHVFRVPWRSKLTMLQVLNSDSPC